MKRVKSATAIGTVAALVVVVLGITGFVAPGFFLSHDHPAPPGSGTTAATVDNGTQEFAATLISALSAHDRDKTVALLCPASPSPNQITASSLAAIWN